MNPTLSERLRRRVRLRWNGYVEPSRFRVPAEPPTALAALMQCRAQAAAATAAVVPPRASRLELDGERLGLFALGASQPQAPVSPSRRAVIVELLVWMLLVLIDGALATVALVRPWARCSATARSAALRLELVP